MRHKAPARRTTTLGNSVALPFRKATIHVARNSGQFSASDPLRSARLLKFLRLWHQHLSGPMRLSGDLGTSVQLPTYSSVAVYLRLIVWCCAGIWVACTCLRVWWWSCSVAALRHA